MSSSQTGGLPTSNYRVGPDTSQLSITVTKPTRTQSPPKKQNSALNDSNTYDYSRPNPSTSDSNKPSLGLDRIFKKEADQDTKIITARDKSPKGLSRESTPTRSNLTTPDISKPGVKASPKPKTSGTSDIGQFDRTRSPPPESVSDVPSKISEGRSNSWEPPRATMPSLGNNLSSLGNSRVNENLHDRFNLASDGGQSLSGPGPALINSINKALEEGRNKGLLSEEENRKRGLKKPAGNSEGGVSLDPNSNPISSPKDNQSSMPVSFPDNGILQPYNSQENTFRNLNLNEEKKRDNSLERRTKEFKRDSEQEQVYSDSNNQDTVKKAGTRGRGQNSEKGGFASDPEISDPKKNNIMIQNQEGQGGNQRDNYHKAYQNIWKDQPERDGPLTKTSPPKRNESSKSNVSTPNRSENGSNERRPRGSSDKRKNNKESPSKYITIESGPKIMADSQRGSFRESGNHSQMQASFQESHQQPKREFKPQSATPMSTHQTPEPNVNDFFGSPMRPNIAMPTFGPDLNVMEVQNYLLFIMNFYEIHMNNLKGIVIQQNETITAQKAKIRKSDDAIEEFREKIEQLQQNIKVQKEQYDQSYEELQDKHKQALDELMTFKRNVDHISKQMDNSAIIRDELDKSHITHSGQDQGDPKASRMILNEIQEIRKELEYQRELINDFKHTKNSLEHQIRDLEKIYHDELRHNSDVGFRHEQVANTMKKYRESYNNLDRLNKIISDGYERTRRELDTVRNSFAPENDGYRRDRRYSPSPQHYQNNQQRDPRDPRDQRDHRDNYLEQNQSPSSYNKLDRPRYRSMTPPHGNQPNDDNAYDAIRKKMKERDDQAKELIYPQSNSRNNNSSGYYAKNARSPSSTLNDRDPQFEIKLNRSPPPPQDRRDRESPSRYHHQQQSYQQQSYQQPHQNRNYSIMPSYQKYEDNREEIKELESLLTDLCQDKKLLENDLFRLPSSGGNIEQKKKKQALERDLEDVDSRIEECRNRLRSLDALTIR